MYGYSSGELVFLSLLVLVPAAFFAFVPPKVRWIVIGVGVVSAAAVAWRADWASAHDGTLLLPLLGTCLAGGALLVEMIAIPIRLIRRRRAAALGKGGE